MKVPFLDLKSQYQGIRAEMQKAVLEVLEEQHFILGPKVEQLERAVAAYCEVPYAVGVSSGSDALLAGLMALGIGTGDEVITTPFTFFATAGSIARLGATPVFADIDAATYNLDPRQIERKIGPKTKAIMPVYLFGQCADMDPILHLAKKHGLWVIEDAAQAIGAKYRGRRAGSLGDLGCLSFFPSKNLGCAGDGGMVVTKHKDLYEKIKLLRTHGMEARYYHKIIGGNFRLDALQAAVLLIKLPYLESWSEQRRNNALKYSELLKNCPVKLPQEYPGNRMIYNQFTIRTRNRDGLRDYLLKNNIGTEIYYPLPLHLQECFGYLGYKPGDLPAAESASKEVISLPIYPELKPSEIEYVAQNILSFTT